MSWAAAQKRMEAARKRDERASLKRQKELERMLKEQAKLSAQEQARLEAEAFENSLDVLLSIHKEASPKFDWMEPLSSLPPHKPMNAEFVGFERERAEWGKMPPLAKLVLAGKGFGGGVPGDERIFVGKFVADAVRSGGENVIRCSLKVGSPVSRLRVFFVHGNQDNHTQTRRLRKVACREEAR